MQEICIQVRHPELGNVLVKDKVMEIKKCRCWGLSLTMGKGLLACTPQIRGLYNLWMGELFPSHSRRGRSFSLSPPKMTGCLQYWRWAFHSIFFCTICTISMHFPEIGDGHSIPHFIKHRLKNMHNMNALPWNWGWHRKVHIWYCVAYPSNTTCCCKYT